VALHFNCVLTLDEQQAEGRLDFNHRTTTASFISSGIPTHQANDETEMENGD
jgi:hypothetical protein